MSSNVISGTKTIAKNSTFLYIRMILLMIVSFISVRIVLKSLGVEDYGVYSAVGGLVVSFSFLSQTLVSASQRFFSIDLGCNDESAINSTYNAILFSYIVLSLLLLLLLETVGLWFLKTKMIIPADRMSAAVVLYQFSIFSFLFTMLTNPYNALLIAHEYMKPYMYISILEAFLKLSAAVILSISCVDRLKLYGVLLFATSFIVFIIYYFLCKKKFKWISFSLKYDIKKIKNVFVFSSWTLFGTLAGVANNQGINLLLNVFHGPIANAAYSVSHQISSAISQVVNNFYSAVRPPLTKSYAVRDYNRTIEIFYFSSKVIFILLGIVAVPIYICIDNLLLLWLGEIQPFMVSFSKLAIVYVLVSSISHPITTIVHAAGSVKLYHVVVDGFILISIPLVWFAFKCNSQPEVAFYISNAIFIVAHALRIIVMRKVVSFSIHDYIIKYIIPCLVIILLTYISTNLLCTLFTSVILKILCSVLISVGLISSLSYILLLSKGEKESIKRGVRSLFKIN